MCNVTHLPVQIEALVNERGHHARSELDTATLQHVRVHSSPVMRGCSDSSSRSIRFGRVESGAATCSNETRAFTVSRAPAQTRPQLYTLAICYRALPMRTVDFKEKMLERKPARYLSWAALYHEPKNKSHTKHATPLSAAAKPAPRKCTKNNLHRVLW